MKILVTLVILLTIIGCNNSSIKAPKEDKLLTQEKTGFAFTLGFFDESSIDEKQLTHKISDGRQYEPTVKITNGYPTSYKFRLFFLVDYTQISFLMDDQKINYLDLKVR